MKSFLTYIVLTLTLFTVGCAGENDSLVVPGNQPWSKRVADSFILRHPNAVTYDTGAPSEKWNYEQGLMLVALLQMYKFSGEPAYFDFVRKNLDQYVDSNGSIRTYKLSDYNIDNIGPGRALLAVYEKTHHAKYRAAADSLRKQLNEQPRTTEGGFWHKKIYPYQMWLDGLFMAEPFYAKYAAMFNEPASYDDIANQFLFILRHTHDPKTGLLYHGWDERKQQRWADPATGCSANFWGRSLGWYAMALVDALDEFPSTHPRRIELVTALQNIPAAIVKYQDEKSGLWFQVIDQGQREGNYLEASASCMFAYSLAKGARTGVLDKKYYSIAQRAFDGICTQLITIDSNGFVDLHGTCRSAGLGGTPYRDGSYEYYLSEPRRVNDMKGIGPFILAAIEIEKGTPSLMKGEK